MFRVTAKSPYRGQQETEKQKTPPEKELPSGDEEDPRYDEPEPIKEPGDKRNRTDERSARHHQIFRNFVAASESVFGFLIADHGFEYLGWEVDGRECTTWFANRPNTTLAFSYEHKSTPMGHVFGRLRPDGEEMVSKYMQSLARQRRPGWQHPQLENGDTSVAELSRVLAVYADLLREQFPEVLAAPDGFGVMLREGFDSPSLPTSS